MHIISVTDFLFFCLNSARKCLILPAECMPQKTLILLEILPAEFFQAYLRAHQNTAPGLVKISHDTTH